MVSGDSRLALSEISHKDVIMCTSTSQQIAAVGSTGTRNGCTGTCAACLLQAGAVVNERNTIDRLVERIRKHRMTHGRYGS